MSNDLTVSNNREVGVFNNLDTFENAQRMANMLSKSDLVPAAYRGRPENCMIAMEMGQRLRISPLMVMQNLHTIEGKPSWSGQFSCAAISASGRFTALRYIREDRGEIDVTYQVPQWENKVKTYVTKKAKIHNIVVRAWATEVSTGEKLLGPEVSVEMAYKEGWATKNGSKWQTMPDLMLHYRAAAFFARVYDPAALLGMHTEDEVIDADFDEADTNNTEPAQVLTPVDQPKKTRTRKQKEPEVQTTQVSEATEPTIPECVQPQSEQETVVECEEVEEDVTLKIPPETPIILSISPTAGDIEAAVEDDFEVWG